MTDYLYAGIAAGILIIAVVAIIILRKVKKNVPCKHKFSPRANADVNGKPRLIKICDKCGIAIHVPIYTRKQLEELESPYHETTA